MSSTASKLLIRLCAPNAPRDRQFAPWPTCAAIFVAFINRSMDYIINETPDTIAKVAQTITKAQRALCTVSVASSVRRMAHPNVQQEQLAKFPPKKFPGLTSKALPLEKLLPSVRPFFLSAFFPIAAPTQVLAKFLLSSRPQLTVPFNANILKQFLIPFLSHPCGLIYFLYDLSITFLLFRTSRIEIKLFFLLPYCKSNICLTSCHLGTPLNLSSKVLSSRAFPDSALAAQIRTFSPRVHCFHSFGSNLDLAPRLLMLHAFSDPT